MTRRKTLHPAIQLAVLILLCEAAGALGILFTADAIPGWYATLTKPVFTPPNWLFGPVWTLLYALMGFGAWRVLQRSSPGAEYHRRAMTFFWLQLVLNAVWTPVFFGAHALLPGLVIIFLLWCSILLMIRAFSAVDRAAAWLQLPYLLWVSFATALNAALWWLNS